MASTAHGSTARAILYAFCANLGIAVAKTWAALYTGSGSMMAEAIHSLADTGNQVLLFVGLKQSRRRPDEEHPLGYGKLSYFWSFVVAMLLFSMGGLFSIYEGVHKLSHPEVLNSLWVAKVVLVLAILLEGTSLLGCIREINALRGERSFFSWLKHTRNSELVVVLGEDSAAQLGLAIALACLAMASLTGNPAWDAAGSIAIGVVLICISVLVAWRIRSLLVGRSADPAIEAEIDRIIAAGEHIAEVYNTITIQYGPDTMLAAKVRMHAGIDIETAARSINQLEVALKAEVPGLRWCFIEPDVAD